MNDVNTVENTLAVCHGVNKFKGTLENPNTELTIDLVSTILNNIKGKNENR